jgi:hypothetical protein
MATDLDQYLNAAQNVPWYSFITNNIFYLASIIPIAVIGFSIYKLLKGRKKDNDKTIEKLKKEKDMAVRVIKNISGELDRLEKEKQNAETTKTTTVEATGSSIDLSNSQKNNPIPSLDLTGVLKEFDKRDDEDYEKSLKVSALEVSHAHEDAQKQLDLQIEKERRARLID